ncbi:MAG: hypothetical protein QM809_16140 [Gordonia sp. (in: high G+C Gram-positive bacteria)]|uniref:hypothetical protein n=1 Tax=Gordonia sp. (in: high G+C Gram-positive bacteria) TaxID=84139 RepID=UPI0039E29ECA
MNAKYKNLEEMKRAAEEQRRAAEEEMTRIANQIRSEEEEVEYQKSLIRIRRTILQHFRDEHARYTKELEVYELASNLRKLKQAEEFEKLARVVSPDLPEPEPERDYTPQGLPGEATVLWELGMSANSSEPWNIDMPDDPDAPLSDADKRARQFGDMIRGSLNSQRRFPSLMNSVVEDEENSGD